MFGGRRRRPHMPPNMYQMLYLVYVKFCQQYMYVHTHLVEYILNEIFLSKHNFRRSQLLSERSLKCIVFCQNEQNINSEHQYLITEKLNVNKLIVMKSLIQTKIINE